MSSGRAFHKVGALLENALYPYVLRLHLGTINDSIGNIIIILLSGVSNGLSEHLQAPEQCVCFCEYEKYSNLS